MAALKIQSQVTVYNLTISEAEKSILIVALKERLAIGIHHDTKMLLMALEGDMPHG